MAKKKNSRTKSVRKGSAKTAGTIDIIKAAKSKYGIIVEFIQRKIDDIRQKVLKSITVLSLMFFGIMFLLFGIAKAIPYYWQLSEAASFMIVGGVVLVIGFIYRLGAKG